MIKLTHTLTAAAIVMALAGCSQAPETQSTASAAPAQAEAIAADNVLLQDFKGPYGGVPAFDKMELSDLKPAMEAAMAEHLAEIEAIANPIIN